MRYQAPSIDRTITNDTGEEITERTADLDALPPDLRAHVLRYTHRAGDDVYDVDIDAVAVLQARVGTEHDAQALLAAISAASTVAELKSALLGGKDAAGVTPGRPG